MEMRLLRLYMHMLGEYEAGAECCAVVHYYYYYIFVEAGA